jgi:hypothetical protein
MSDDQKASKASTGRVNVSFSVGAAVLLLTLAVWVFFYVEQMPLDPGSTAIVALVATLLVLAVRRLWTRRLRTEPKLDREK